MKVFDHDTSFEEDEQEETDGKSDGSGGKHDKKIDDKQVSNEFKKGIMLSNMLLGCREGNGDKVKINYFNKHEWVIWWVIQDHNLDRQEKRDLEKIGKVRMDQRSHFFFS